MKFRFVPGAFAVALTATLVAGLATAQSPQPQPATPPASATTAQVSIPAAPTPAS